MKEFGPRLNLHRDRGPNSHPLYNKKLPRFPPDNLSLLEFQGELLKNFTLNKI